MTILTWNDQFILGIASIDQQHQRLVDIINQLDEAVAVGGEPQAILELTDALIDYTSYHFTHEEALMRQAGYNRTEYARHKLQHDQFVARVVLERENAATDPDAVSAELLEFLVEWLSEHILVSDKQMVLELGRQGLVSEETLRQQQSGIMQSNLYSALRESENRFKQLADHLPALIWLANIKRQPVFCNQFCLKTLGLARLDLNSGHWLDAIDPRDRQRLQDAHDTAIAERRELQLEYRVTQTNGQPLWILETVVPRLRKNGQLAGLMGCGMDISMQKSAESRLEELVQQRTQELTAANHNLQVERNQQIALNRRLKDMQSQLIQTEKMASIGQLAAGVAHEINNPLGYISSNLNTCREYLQELLATAELAAQLAADAPGHPAAQALNTLQQRSNLAFIKQDLPDLLNEAQEGASRAKKIVQDLRDFSRVDKQQQEIFDLEAGIEATLNIVNSELRCKAEIIKEYAGLKPFPCIGSQINQVVMNLLVNAAQAITGFGKIHIRTGIQQPEYIWFEVEDTGSGIPDDLKTKIFDPFFTTKPVGKGTGLGLSLSYKIIQDHNGRIELHSVPGKGSRFRVYLPCR